MILSCEGQEVAGLISRGESTVFYSCFPHFFKSFRDCLVVVKAICLGALSGFYGVSLRPTVATCMGVIAVRRQTACPDFLVSEQHNMREGESHHKFTCHLTRK